MKRRTRVASVSLALMGVTGIALTACTDAAGIDPRLTSFELDSTLYMCDRWLPEPPAAERALFDIYWSPSEQNDNSPSAEQLRMLQAAGGEVIHQFDLPAVRAIVPVSQIPLLEATRVVAVSDSRFLDVYVWVRFDRPLTEADLQFFGSLGGRLDLVYAPANQMSGFVSDRALRTLRGRNGVVSIEAPVTICLR